MTHMTRIAPRRLRPWLALLVMAASVSIVAQTPAPSTAQSSRPSPDRGQPPTLGPPPALRLPAIQKTTLSNGVPVWIVEQHRVPLVQVNVILRGGGSLDRASRFGMASLVAGMLDEGAGTRSALELADAVDLLGADLSTSSSFDYSAVRLSTPVKNLSAAVPLLADVVLRPTFPAAELDRLKQERLTALMQALRVSARRVRARAPLRLAGERIGTRDPGHHGRRGARVLQGALRHRSRDHRGGR
jgi:zinc protease